jgi:glutaredoxin 3
VNIKIYTTPTCGYCHQAKQYFKERGVNYSEYDVSKDSVAANDMVKISGQMGVPVIVVDGAVIVGFDRPRLEQLLRHGNHKKRVSLGVSVADASSIMGKLGSAPVAGAFIGRVAPLSPGERAKLQEGDIITKINLHNIRNADDLEAALSSISEGNRVVITFLRDSNSRQSEIML